MRTDTRRDHVRTWGGDGVHAPRGGASGRPASDVSLQSCNSTRLCGVTRPSPRSGVPAARPEVTETTADPEERHGSLGRRAVPRPGRRTSAGVSGLRGGCSREGGAPEGQARLCVSLRPANRAQPSFPALDNECPRSGERTRVCQARVHTAGHTCTPPRDGLGTADHRAASTSRGFNVNVPRSLARRAARCGSKDPRSEQHRERLTDTDSTGRQAGGPREGTRCHRSQEVRGTWPRPRRQSQ